MLDTQLLVRAVFLNAGAGPARLAQWLRANTVEGTPCTDSVIAPSSREGANPSGRG